MSIYWLLTASVVCYRFSAVQEGAAPALRNKSKLKEKWIKERIEMKGNKFFKKQLCSQQVGADHKTLMYGWPITCPPNPSWPAAGVACIPRWKRSYPSSDLEVSIHLGHDSSSSQEQGDSGTLNMATEQQAQRWVMWGCGSSEVLFTRSSI